MLFDALDVLLELLDLPEEDVNVGVVLRENLAQIPVDLRDRFEYERVVYGVARHIQIDRALDACCDLVQDL